MSNYSDQDIFLMQKAYQQAWLANQAGQVPRGAVL
ncbi:nucleoside deaminase, partial [Francisella tularensis subsp. holarctica]|nr:nucleoside deaminase [Francisella tularensis subsp. holarctica]